MHGHLQCPVFPLYPDVILSHNSRWCQSIKIQIKHILTLTRHSNFYIVGATSCVDITADASKDNVNKVQNLDTGPDTS